MGYHERMEKRCTGCGVSKLETDFDRVRKGNEKRKARCKDCVRAAKGHIPHPHWATMQRNKELLPLGRKICNKCLVEKNLGDFYRHSKNRGRIYMGGLAPSCKACVLRRDRMKKYGMTWDEVVAAEAVTHCPGCLRELGLSGTKRCFDHCHESGTFRRVLCETCNIAVGMVANSPDTLRRLADLYSTS